MGAPSHLTGTQPSKHPGRLFLELLAPEWPELKAVVSFAVAGALLSLAAPIAVDAFLSNVTFGTLVQPLVILSAGLLFAYVLLGFFAALQSYAIEIIQRRLFVRIAGEFSGRLPSVRRDLFDRVHGPELINRFLEVVTLQKKTAELIFYAVNTVLATLAGMLVLTFFHPALMVFVAVLLGLVLLVIVPMGRGGVRTSVAESASKYELMAWLEDLARHETTFSTDLGAQHAMQRADEACQGYLRNRIKHFRILFRQTIGGLVLQGLAATSILAIGGWLVINQQLTIGQLVASELIVTNIASNIGKLGTMLSSWYDVCAAADKLHVVLDLPQERAGGASLDTATQGFDLEVSGLDYAYAGQPPLIRGFNGRIAAGERVAILGMHGSGISTLLEVLCGLRQPTAGFVTFGGVDLRQLDLKRMRRSMVLVRGPEIFAGSVLENLTLDVEQADLDAVRRVLELLELWEPIMRLPEGLETRLDTAGPSLSSSEAMRLTLARALLLEPKVLLLDNALDGLDAGLRERVTGVLLAPERPWTVLLASQYRSPREGCTRQIQLPAPRLSTSPDGPAGDSNQAPNGGPR